MGIPPTPTSELQQEIARLRAALEAIIVSDDPVTIAIKALAKEGE